MLFRSLDAEYAGAIIDLFVDFNRVGVTVMIATHDEQAIARASGSANARTLRLAGGRLEEAELRAPEPTA